MPLSVLERPVRCRTSEDCRSLRACGRSPRTVPDARDSRLVTAGQSFQSMDQAVPGRVKPSQIEGRAPTRRRCSPDDDLDTVQRLGAASSGAL